MTGNLPQNFSEYFKEMSNQHNFNTRRSKEGIILKITQKTTTYGLNSIHHRAANDWNELLKILDKNLTNIFLQNCNLPKH